MVLISPGRQSAATSTDADTISMSMINDELFGVLSTHETLGYVHRVGNVFVALRGGEYNHAVEVGQTRSRERAVELVRAG